MELVRIETETHLTPVGRRMLEDADPFGPPGTAPQMTEEERREIEADEWRQTRGEQWL